MDVYGLIAVYINLHPVSPRILGAAGLFACFNCARIDKYETIEYSHQTQYYKLLYQSMRDSTLY